MKLPGVVKTSSTESEAAMEAGNEVKVESDDEVEPYDGSYACLICTNSVRGQPALVCLQCNCNPWHRECDKEEKYVELCPQCGKKSVQEFTGESFVTAAPSVVVDLTGEGGGGAEAVALTEHGARENATEEQPQLAVGGGVMAAEVVERGAQGGRADAGNGSSGNGKEDAGAANGKRKAEEEAAAHLVHNTVDTLLCFVCQERKTVREFSAKKRKTVPEDCWCRECCRKSHRAEKRASRPRYTPCIATREMVAEHLVGQTVMVGGRVVNYIPDRVVTTQELNLGLNKISDEGA